MIYFNYAKVTQLQVAPNGKRRAVATHNLNMKQYASIDSKQHTLLLDLKPITRKITSVQLELTLNCVLLREGKATSVYRHIYYIYQNIFMYLYIHRDEDMQSIASLMSVNNTVEADVAHLDDFEVDDITDTAELMDITQQLDMLTNSLTGSTSTPMSGMY